MSMDEVMEILGEMRKICYVKINGIEFNSEVPYAQIDFGTYIIQINPAGVEEFERKGMSRRYILRGLLQHEFLGHRSLHPFNVTRIVAESIALQEIGAEKIDFVRNKFDDIVANLKVWNIYGEKELFELYKNLESRNKLDLLEKMLYQTLLGIDLGVGEVEELRPYVERLRKIKFLSGTPVKLVRDCMRQIRRFYRIIKPLLEEIGETGKWSGPTLAELPEDEVEKAVKELIEKGEITPETAKKFLEEYAESRMKKHGEMEEEGEMEEGKEMEVKEEGGKPGGKFLQSPDRYANKVLYNILSERYRLKIKGLPLVKSGGVYPSGYGPWEFGDPIEDIDLFVSYGIIAPGITKKVIRREILTFGGKEKIPDLVLLLDDSGSMPDPTKGISNAVISAFAVCKNYVRNGAKVAPIRFSDRTTTPQFSGNESEILDELLKFKGGGDTRVDIDDVEKVVGNRRKKDLDVIVITDGEIGNRSKLIQYISQFGRAFMFEIGKGGKEWKEGNVVIYPIGKAEDIAKVVIEKVI